MGDRDRTLVHIICRNPECRWHGQVRTVRRVFMGQGIYAMPHVSCECSPELELVRVDYDGEPL